MLIRNPAEFEHVARDWAVKFASAPRKERGQSSGGATAESLRKKKDEARRKSEKEKLAQYVLSFNNFDWITPGNRWL